MSEEITQKVRSKIMVYRGKGVVKGPADGPWDCPEDILGVLLEENAVELIETDAKKSTKLPPEIQAIMDEGSKAYIEAELKAHGQSFAPSLKPALAAQLHAVRTDLVKQIKDSMTVDEIKDELWSTHGVEYPKEAKEAELAILLLSARRTAKEGV